MKSKIAIITGASRGIGQAIALRFAKEGYQLGLCCHHKGQQLEETANACLVFGIKCVTMTFDIGDEQKVHEFMSLVRTQLGEPSVLVNNAGIAHIGLLTDMSTKQWQLMMNTNLNSAFYTCREVIPSMVHNHAGSIINISSVWGNVGASCEVAYSTTKGGINSFTKALAKELAPSGVAVNAIAFGFMDTEMNQELTKEDKAKLLEEIPASRAGTPQEAADLVFRIATSSTYLTGQVITMDGGWC